MRAPAPIAVRADACISSYAGTLKRPLKTLVAARTR